MDHTKSIITLLAMTVDAYRSRHEDCDINDVMSALGWLLCDLATDYEVSREYFHEKLMQTFDTVVLHNHDRRDD